MNNKTLLDIFIEKGVIIKNKDSQYEINNHISKETIEIIKNDFEKKGENQWQ